MTTDFRHIIALSFVAIASCRVAKPRSFDVGTNGILVSWRVGEYPIGDASFYEYHAAPVPGVSVCYYDITGKNTLDKLKIRKNSDCDDTDDKGVFKLEGVPKYSEVLITLDNPDGGFSNRLVPVKTGYYDLDFTQDIQSKKNPYPNLLAPMVKTDNRERAGCPTQVPEGGNIVVLALLHSEDGGVPDFTAKGIQSSLSDAIVEIIGNDEDGIGYSVSDVNGRCASSHIIVGRSTKIGDGFVTFYNLKRGRHRVSFSVPKSYFCEVAGVPEGVVLWGFRTDAGYNGDDSSIDIEVPVIEKYTTITILRCYRIAGSGPTDAGDADADGSDEQ